MTTATYDEVKAALEYMSRDMPVDTRFMPYTDHTWQTVPLSPRKGDVLRINGRAVLVRK